ncbi:unnamed protein product [Schistosoma mattheei]|uniref:Uncharacterized protein n=1 Tax=Schistosoma mattheei TaxID=31246 RepID=A0A3P7Y9R9_9TREM|nr:unnamed protein product [Schistosoma mattheei]
MLLRLLQLDLVQVIPNWILFRSYKLLVVLQHVDYVPEQVVACFRWQDL